MLEFCGGFKLSKSKVILVLCLAITIIVSVFLRMKPYSAGRPFVSIERLSSDQRHNAKNSTAGRDSMLMTSRHFYPNVSSGGIRGKSLGFNKKALTDPESNCEGKSCLDADNLSANQNQPILSKESNDYHPYNQRKGSSNEIQSSLHQRDSILLSTSKSLLDYPRPDYQPGYLSPCLDLEMETLNSMIRETWKQNSALLPGVSSHLNVNPINPRLQPELNPSPDGSDFKLAPQAERKYSQMGKQHGENKSKVGLCLPGFFLVGIRKSGTSDLAYKLMKHQQIYTGTKEGHFFDSLTMPQCSKFVFRQWSFNLLQYLALLKWGSVGEAQTSAVKMYNGSINLDMMRSVYKPKQPYGRDMLLGDYTPAYSTKVREVCSDKSTMTFQTPLKIKHLVPDAKIIFILRDPISRASSDIRYAMTANNLHVNKASDMVEKIHKAFVKAIRWWRKCTSQYGEGSYECVFGTCWNLSDIDQHFVRALRNGVYYAYVQEYLNVFSGSQVMVVDTGTYATDPINYIEELVLPFLGLPPYNENVKNQIRLSMQERANQNTKTTFQLLEKTQEMLREFYKPYDKKLSRLLGGRTFSWFQDY